MTPNLAVALIYVRRGVSILPCREADGRGGTAKAPYIEGGWHSASASEAQVRSWWTTWPNAAIGLPCRANEVIALDADRHGQGDGVAALFALFAQHGFAPNAVPCVVTPRDGRHCVFRRPIELSDTKARIAPAIDVRDRAYVVAAGSVMANGGRYTVQNGSLEQLAAAIGSASLPELPQWLVATIEKPPLLPPASIERARSEAMAGCDVERRLTALVRKVVLATKGERNAVLHWAACRAGELVSAGAIHGETAVALFTEAGRHAGLPIHEARATARSGVHKGQASADHGR